MPTPTGVYSDDDLVSASQPPEGMVWVFDLVVPGETYWKTYRRMREFQDRVESKAESMGGVAVRCRIVKTFEIVYRIYMPPGSNIAVSEELFLEE